MEVNDNIKRFNDLKKEHTNIKTQICCTINVQNIYNLEAVAHWIESQPFDYVFYNYLHEAKEWNVQYLPKQYKQIIQTKLLSSKVNGPHRKELSRAVVFMMDKDLGDDQMHWLRKQKIIASDNYRQQSFVDVHPEYKGLI